VKQIKIVDKTTALFSVAINWKEYFLAALREKTNFQQLD